jgi:hypothetical protein
MKHSAPPKPGVSLQYAGTLSGVVTPAMIELVRHLARIAAQADHRLFRETGRVAYADREEENPS